MEKLKLVVLGAGGFVGRETVRHAVDAGAHVTAVARSANAAFAGAHTIMADAANTQAWIESARGATAVIDLVQPALPSRVTRGTLRRMATYRAGLARTVADAIAKLPARERPVYVTVSGVAELVPDDAGRVSHRSRIADRPRGFGVIGASVAHAVASAGVTTIRAHLGTVYGPGKTFAERMVPGLRAGRFPVVGSGDNHVGLVHVSDAASALVHVARLGPMASATRWIITEGDELTLGQFIDGTAAALAAPRPRRIPRWMGALVLGAGLADELTKDARPDPSALVASGWSPRFPTAASGVAATLASLEEK